MRIPDCAAIPCALAVIVGAAAVVAAPTQQIIGSAAFGPGSVLLMEVGGTTPGAEHDQLIVTGTLIVDGTLQVTLLNGFTPMVDDEFILIDVTTFGGTLQGEFAVFDLPTIAPELEWLWDAGVLSVGCRFDINGDNTIDTADLGILISQFGMTGQGLAADFNNDGVVDTADLGSLIGSFGGVCSP